MVNLVLLLLIGAVSLNVMPLFPECVGQRQFRRTTDGSGVDP
jgi:hypothetical protein